MDNKTHTFNQAIKLTQSKLLDTPTSEIVLEFSRLYDAYEGFKEENFSASDISDRIVKHIKQNQRRKNGQA